VNKTTPAVVEPVGGHERRGAGGYRVDLTEGEIVTEYMTAPTMNGDKPLPRRAGTRGMVPSTWISHELRLEYIGADGMAKETKATLLDWCPVGLLVSVGGAKTLLVWERLVLAELVEG
jgi:hypothetical protein